MPTETEIAWVAGILDGEAWFGHAGNSARISLAMVDRDLVERVAKIFDLRPPRPVHPPKHRPNRQLQWGINVSGRDALAMMRTVLPYLGERRTAKVRVIERLMGEKYDPRACIECGTMFVSHERAPLSQKFCSNRCASRAGKRRRRNAYAASLGRTPEQRCGVATPTGSCRIYPLKDQQRCRWHANAS